MEQSGPKPAVHSEVARLASQYQDMLAKMRDRTTLSTEIRNRLLLLIFKSLGMPGYLQVYAASLALLALTLVASRVGAFGDQILTIALYVAFNGFIVGFALWAWPLAQDRWSGLLGSAAKVVLHVFAGLVATAAARNQVSVALGLPAQDFDLTVAFVAVFLYIPSWMLVVSAALMLSYVITVPGLLWSVAISPEVQQRRFFIGAAHLVGASGVAVYGWTFFGWAAQDKPALHSTILTLAAIVDYQPAAAYPGLAPGERVRLHENGVVSSVESTPQGIKVRVRSL